MCRGQHSDLVESTKRIRVCHILNSLLPSGAETMLANSGDLWINCEKHILATQPELGNYSETLQKAGYQIHHIARDNFIQQHLAVQHFLKELRPDVVHIHREGQEFYYALDAKLARVPSIVRTVHNVFDFHGMLRLRRVITRGLSRNLGTKYIAIGRSVFDNEKYNFKNEPLKIVDNWCDELRFQFISENNKKSKRETHGIPEDTFVIVSVGNCSFVKNHMLLLKAIEKIVNTKLDVKILYLHIGSGKNEEAEKTYVKEHNLEHNVRFLGYVDPVQYYQLADLYLMPSLYEGVGISALEAMFCGIPCMLTDVVGLCDFKQLESEDIYYSTLDDVDFVDRLTKLSKKFQRGELNNSKELSNLAHEKYNRKNSVQEYIETYR